MNQESLALATGASILIPATLVFENPIANPSEINGFLKNIGLIGALLMVIYTGAGALSIDSHPE